MDSPHVAHSDKHTTALSQKYDPETPREMPQFVVFSSGSVATQNMLPQQLFSCDENIDLFCASLSLSLSPRHTSRPNDRHLYQQKGATWPALATILSSRGVNSALKSLSASVPSLRALKP
jgi:hypothetical protein